MLLMLYVRSEHYTEHVSVLDNDQLKVHTLGWG